MAETDPLELRGFKLHRPEVDLHGDQVVGRGPGEQIKSLDRPERVLRVTETDKGRVPVLGLYAHPRLFLG